MKQRGRRPPLFRTLPTRLIGSEGQQSDVAGVLETLLGADSG